ncbi:MAG: hypothetical protein JRF02_04135 [Deltaproteobacteria bacterium]|nr:hypothetical protein [Deltaproteobacteria bacterium]
MGGLSKKAYQLEKIRGLYDTPYLTVDGGNLLFKRESLPSALLQQAEITAGGIIDAYNLMEHDAVAVGRNDLAAGLHFLREQASRSTFKWLSANLVSKTDGKPIFQTSLIRTLGDLTIGVIGLTGQNGRSLFRHDEDAAILPWQEVLPGLVSELASQCDLLILLSNNPVKLNREIAASLENIHLIIQSAPSSRNTSPELTNKSLIAQTGKQGKFLGWMLIDWTPSKTWGRKGAVKELTLKKQELDGINGRISRIERREKKDALPGNRSYQNLLKTRERLLAQIELLKQEQDNLRNTDHALSTFENNFIALDIKLPDHAEVERIVSTTKERVNLAGRSKAEETVVSPDRAMMSRINSVFSGWRTCAQCHPEQTDFWEKTDHAIAYQTLAEQGQQFNLDCLPCHVTAEYRDTRISEDDAVLLSLPATLQQVGCEVCHGPGITHIAGQDPAKISRKPEPAVCLRCHTPERDEEFNYANDLEKIACPSSSR